MQIVALGAQALTHNSFSWETFFLLKLVPIAMYQLYTDLIKMFLISQCFHVEHGRPAHSVQDCHRLNKLQRNIKRDKNGLTTLAKSTSCLAAVGAGSIDQYRVTINHGAIVLQRCTRSRIMYDHVFSCMIMT